MQITGCANYLQLSYSNSYRELSVFVIASKNTSKFPLDNEHRITVGEELVLVLDCHFVGFLD